MSKFHEVSKVLDKRTDACSRVQYLVRWRGFGTKYDIAMISFAIINAPEKKLTVQGIYEFMMRHFPSRCRSDNKKSWQNTVRYTLSSNDCFVKVPEDCDGCNEKHESASRNSYWGLHPDSVHMFEDETCLQRRRTRFRKKASESPSRASRTPSFPTRFEPCTIHHTYPLSHFAYPQNGKNGNGSSSE